MKRPTSKHGPANKGVLALFGVLNPRALLAITPRKGVFSGILALCGREGVSAGEPKKRGTSGKDCSPCVPSSIGTSPSSEEGKSSGGGEDMASKRDASRHGNIDLRAGGSRSRNRNRLQL